MANEVEISKLNEYVVEGAPSSAVVVSKLGEYVVEGAPGSAIVVSKLALYVVEGPSDVVTTSVQPMLCVST